MKTKTKVDMRQYSLVLILIAMVIICSFLSPNFLSAKNLTNILKQVSIVTICAFAQGMIIICGHIDLSIGYLAGMAGSYSYCLCGDWKSSISIYCRNSYWRSSWSN